MRPRCDDHRMRNKERHSLSLIRKYNVALYNFSQQRPALYNGKLQKWTGIDDKKRFLKKFRFSPRLKCQVHAILGIFFQKDIIALHIRVPEPLTFKIWGVKVSLTKVYLVTLFSDIALHIRVPEPLTFKFRV